MNTVPAARRRSPPTIVWGILCILAVAATIAVALGALAWREARHAEALQAELDALNAERQTMEDQIVQLQGTTTVLEDRLSSLEARDPAQQLAILEARLETTDDGEEIAKLRSDLAEIQAQVNAFQATVEQLADKMEVMSSPGLSTEALPPSQQLEVARQRQSHNLSCESSAAAMVAQYHGVDLTEAQVLAALPYDANPYLGFRGNVDGPTGGIEDYGVYAGPVLQVLQDRGLRAWPVTDGLQGIKAAIARGNPVIAWVTYNCLPSTSVETLIDGETVVLVPNQHVVVVTGYDANGVWANDPWDGLQDFYTYAEFESAMAYFGDMAIEVAGP